MAKNDVEIQLVDKIKKIIEKQPVKLPSKISKDEALEKLKPAIKELLNKNYDFNEISIMLTTEGFNIKPASLRKLIS